jgi:plasmid stability protein
MRQVLIRNVDDNVLRTLKDRASAQGKSLEQLLRDILSDAAEPNAARRLALADRIRSLTPPGEQSDSTGLIRKDRRR